MLPLLLALMMVGDARATFPAKFTDRDALRNAVRACLHSSSGVSTVGNCCAPQGSTDSPDIVAGTDADDGNCKANGYTHLRDWDVSSVGGMRESELCVIRTLGLPFVCCVLLFKVSARVFSLSSLSLLCVSSPYIDVQCSDLHLLLTSLSITGKCLKSV